MPFEIRWEVPRRVIYERFYDIVTIQDMRGLQEQVAIYNANGDMPVHAIVDLLDVVDYPKNISQLREVLLMRSGSDGIWVLLIYKNPLLGFMSTILTRLAMQNTRFRVFPSVALALEFLETQDPSIKVIAM